VETVLLFLEHQRMAEAGAVDSLAITVAETADLEALFGLFLAQVEVSHQQMLAKII
jgi:hypothetical protein